MRTVLITGGSGSWGRELTRQILTKKAIKEVRIYSRGEQKQVEMKRNLPDTRIKFIIGDIRDKSRLIQVTYGVDVIFSLAALKHVPVCEENAWETVQTNVCGTQNVIEAAWANRVKKVVYVSSDKAVDPINIYGVTKSCSEKLIVSANGSSGKTIFSVIRAGNVLGSSGSVTPLFKYQIEKFNEVTITDRRMSRFLVRLPEVVQFLIKAAEIAKGGEILVMKAPAVKVVDLAKVMIQELGNRKTKVRLVGIRPGEKLFETLVSRYEASQCCDHGDYFVIKPKELEPLRSGEYNSENTKRLNQREIREMLAADGWLTNWTKSQ